MRRTSRRALSHLGLFLVIGFIGLGFPQVLSFQAPRGLTGDVFVRRGFDRLLWDWKFETLDGLTCFNQFTKTSKDGFFCDATQLTTGLAEDLATYKQLLGNVFDLEGNHNPDIKRLVEQYRREGKPIKLSDLFMFTKEQIEFGKGNPDSNIMPYFVQRDRGTQEKYVVPPGIRILSPPKKNVEDTFCSALHFVHDNGDYPRMGGEKILEVYAGFDSGRQFPDFHRLFRDNPSVYDDVAKCWELPPKQTVEPWKNFIVAFGTSQSFPQWAFPGAIPLEDGIDPFANPEIIDLNTYSLTKSFRGGGEYRYVVSLEALLRHEECCPEKSLLVRLKKRLDLERQKAKPPTLPATTDFFFSSLSIFLVTPNSPNLPEDLKRYVRRFATNWRPENFRNGLNIPGYDPVRPLAPFDTPTSFVPGTFFGFNLIGDNYSPAFLKDWVDHYSRPGNGFPAQYKGHALLDPSMWRVEARIGTGNAPRKSTGTRIESGLYDIDIGGTARFTDTGVEYKDVTIFLDRNMTLAEFDKATEKEPVPTEYSKNLFLRLPFDGPVGRQADGSFRRTDYGVAITYDPVPAQGQRPVVRLHGEGEEARGFDELVAIQGPGHVPLTVRASDFYQDVRNGRLFSLKPSGAGYRLEYTPSAPHLFNLKATPAATEPVTDLYYAFLDRAGEPLKKTDYAAPGQTLNPSSLFNWVSGAMLVSDAFQENAQPGYPCTGWTTSKPAARLSHANATDFLSVAYSRLDHPQRGDAILGLLCAKGNAVLTMQYYDGQTRQLSVGSTYLKPAAPNTVAALAIGRYSPTDSGGVHRALVPNLQTYIDLLNAETFLSQLSQNPQDRGTTCLENKINENNLSWYPQHIFPGAPMTMMNPCQ
jgi:hypothetical protein